MTVAGLDARADRSFPGSGSALLFLFFGWAGEPADPASRSITVTREDRAALALQWERTMQRPPTDAELDTLVENFLREEVLYREAIRLGLDRDDPVVRKRLANKMDYLAASMARNGGSIRRDAGRLAGGTSRTLRAGCAV